MAEPLPRVEPPGDVPDALGLCLTDWSWHSGGVGESGDQVYRLNRLSVPTRYLKVSRRGTGLLQAEHDALAWLNGKLPVPAVLGYSRSGGIEFLLTREQPGLVACDPELAVRMPADAIVRELASALRRVHAVPVEGCPMVNRLAERIPRALDASRRKGEAGADAARAFMALPRPAEDLVFTHGDYCEPNILFQDGRVSGFIDVGYAGTADRYTDLSQMVYSLRRNGHGDLIPFFFATYGIPAWDTAKVAWYRALEDLF